MKLPDCPYLNDRYLTCNAMNRPNNLGGFCLYILDLEFCPEGWR